VLTLLVAVVTMTQASQVLARDAADRTELSRLEAVWNDAHVKGDADALDRLWANDLVVTVAGMPVMNKTESLAMFRSGRMPFTKYETSEVLIRPHGDSAVVTGRVRRVRSMGGREVQDDWRFTKVYVRAQGQWQVVSWHASP